MASKRWRCSYCHRTVTKDIKPTSDGCPGNKKMGKMDHTSGNVFPDNK